ncbi:MAG: hypothetical protein HWN66_01195 [Candidatus Helarchaeota archaeon]|nr:hypothetical protein [Candidatus Helarchaeota archaeon]
MDFIVLVGLVIIRIKKRGEANEENISSNENIYINQIPDWLNIKEEVSSELNLGRRTNIHLENSEVVDVCMVCNLPIYQDEPVLECPTCQSRAHRDHLLEWFKIKGFCPNCGNKLQNLYKVQVQS